MTQELEAHQAWLDGIWARLTAAPEHRQDPWRIPSMATVSSTMTPEVRQVVLRRADSASRTLEIHTDRASAKYDSLRQHPSAEFCFWNPRLQTQVRLSGTAILRTGDDAELSWTSLAEPARAIYSVSPPPGTRLKNRHDFDHSSPARFVSVLTRIDRIDALCLSRPKHQRMLAQWNGEVWQATWIVP